MSDATQLASAALSSEAPVSVSDLVVLSERIASDAKNREQAEAASSSSSDRKLSDGDVEMKDAQEQVDADGGEETRRKKMMVMSNERM